MTVRRPSGNIWGAKESTVSQASETERQAGQPESKRRERGRRGKGQGWSALGQRLLGFIYLGGRRRGSLAVGGLRAKASSFGDGGGRGWLLGGRRGADYDRGGHGEVGSLCGEGLLAPLLKGAARKGSESHPCRPMAFLDAPAPTDAPEKRVVGTARGGGAKRLSAEARGAPGSRHLEAKTQGSSVHSVSVSRLPAPPDSHLSRPVCLCLVHSLSVIPLQRSSKRAVWLSLSVCQSASHSLSSSVCLSLSLVCVSVSVSAS